MPNEWVWYSHNSITIYHIFGDCRALKNVDSADIKMDQIELDRYYETEKPTMKLCGHCEDILERIENIPKDDS